MPLPLFFKEYANSNYNDDTQMRIPMITQMPLPLPNGNTQFGKLIETLTTISFKLNNKLELEQKQTSNIKKNFEAKINENSFNKQNLFYHQM